MLFCGYVIFNCKNTCTYTDYDYNCIVPAPGNCTAEWTKNPDRVFFTWGNVTIPDGIGDDKADYSYYLGYWVDDEISYYNIPLGTQFKSADDFDFSVGTSMVAGTIQTRYDGFAIPRYSKPVDCTTITQTPSQSPTGIPTRMPIEIPTATPTEQPTWSNPYLFIGGDICSAERCDCQGSSISCTSDDIYVSWRYVLYILYI